VKTLFLEDAGDGVNAKLRVEKKKNLSICRVCGANEVEGFLSFGKLPMGNAFLRKDQLVSEPTFDLDLGFCPNCKLVQQINPAPLDVIQSVYRNYAYVPYGITLESHYAALGKAISDELDLKEGSFALDIGSNDGILLKSIKRNKGSRVLGVEPAVRISEMARQSGVPTITAFFTSEVATRIGQEHGQADVITATQVLQHIPNVKEFLENIVRILKPNGVLVIESRYFADTIVKTTFDTVYHEMIYFFTLESLVNLLVSVGMTVYKAEHVDIYGGSLRIFSRRQSVPPELSAPDRGYGDLLVLERDTLHLNRLSAYLDFARRVRLLRTELQSLVNTIKESGNKIAGYGAPSTGTTLLSFCGIGKEQIEYIVDDNPLKQGLLTPGTHIPIVPSSQLVTQPPDYLLIIAWRLASEIIPKVKPLIGRGKKAIIPLPQPTVVNLHE